MKRCPACQRAYGDEQNFCLDDGTTLVADAAGSYGHSNAQTEVMQSPQTAGNRYAPQTQPPPFGAPYATPAYAASQPQKRSPLPWILLGALVLIAGVVGIILATRDSGTTTTGISNPGSTPSASPGSTPRSSPAPPTSSGITYNSDDGRFQITLPPGFSTFKSQKQNQATPAGNIELNILQTETASGACLMGFSDFPAASWVGRTPQKMMEDGRDGALRNINATLEKQEQLTVQGKDALNVYGSTASGGRSIYVRFQFVLDKPRAYQIGYLAYNRADLDKPEIQAYFDSFRLK
jgi:hypothetical protein